MNIHFKFFSLLVLLTLPITAMCEDNPKGYTIIEDLAKEPILTPSLAKRQVLKIKLDNGLEAILISDPLADKSAAILTVRTGSFQDPVDYPGIAHFLEHMLFLGTKKYPEESGYQHFIAENGGTTNAFTTNDFTGYLFSVNNQAFPTALDRFAEFFKEPLFNPSGVSRELQAIDQEYAKNVQNDNIRSLYVMKEMTTPSHPYHHFGMGNSKTLSKVSQETLIDWYKKNYSANLMRLMVYSKLPLDELKTNVVKDFQAIINKNVPPHKSSAIPFNIDENRAKMVYIEPIKNLRSLTIIWSLPPKFANVLDRQPESYACYVLGDESEGSLLAELKKEQLAESLGCASYKIDSVNQIFYIDIDLTENGVKDVNLVIKRVFQAIATLKKEEPPKYIFDELTQVQKIKYRYKNREDIFESFMKDAMKLPYESIQTFPVQSYIVQNFDPELIKDYIQNLNPNNAQFFLLAPSTLTGIATDKKEQWLGTKYAVKEIENNQMKQWEEATAIPEITLPAANTFIPKDLSILNKIEAQDIIPIPKPEVILDEPFGIIYFAKDTLFGVPEIYFNFDIKTPEIKSGTSKSVVLADLYVKALKDALNKLSYPATVAGINFDIKRSDNGINVTITGFNGNANILLKEIAKTLKQLKVNEDTFLILKESLLREYENAYKSSPLKVAIDQMRFALYKNYTTEPKKAVAIKNIDFQTFNDFSTQIFNQIYVEGLIYGNATEESALETKEILLNSLTKNPYLKSDHLQKLVIDLPENKGPYYIEKNVDVQGNAIILFLENSGFSFQKKAAQEILMQAIEGPFFSTLRTKQQTGYIVGSKSEEIEEKLFNLFIIQSNTHDPYSLLARIELFIEGFNQEIGEVALKKENFETIKRSLIENLLNSYNNTKLMGEMLKKLAFQYHGDFNWTNKLIQAFDDLTYEEFVRMSHALLNKSNKQRFGILIDGIISEDTKFQYIKLQTVKQLRKLSQYSSGNCCDFYPNKVK